MTDVGVRLVELLYEQLMIDDQWAVRRPRGFTWGTVSERCATAIHDEILPWTSKILATEMAIQNSSAHSRAHAFAEACGGQPAVTAHPTSGERPEADDMLNLGAGVIVPEGRHPSRFAGSRMAAVQQFLVESGFLGTADETGLTCEVPFTANIPAVVAAATQESPQLHTSLVQIFTDQAHPEFGNGLLMIMRLPISPDQDTVPAMANELNLVASAGGTFTSLLGAWCPHPASPQQLAFCRFVPNVLAPLTMVEDLVSHCARNSEFVARHLLG